MHIGTLSVPTMVSSLLVRDTKHQAAVWEGGMSEHTCCDTVVASTAGEHGNELLVLGALSQHLTLSSNVRKQREASRGKAHAYKQYSVPLAVAPDSCESQLPACQRPTWPATAAAAVAHGVVCEPQTRLVLRVPPASYSCCGELLKVAILH